MKSKILHERIQVRLELELKRQKECGKKFISDEEIDALIVEAIKIEAGKKTLVIHPKDKSTTFLEPIYKDIPNKTVVQDGLRRSEILDLIRTHDRIIMLGHGSPSGLLNMGQFPDCRYVIDSQMVMLLSQKKDNIFIWCYADQFVNQYILNGFYSGLFISEVSEAIGERISNPTQIQVDESNNRFSKVLGGCVNCSTEQIFDTVIQEYGDLTITNKIAQYNHSRLYFRI